MLSDVPPERIRLRVKLGTEEFEAVGPAEVVASHFRTWQALVGKVPADPAPQPPAVAPAERSLHGEASPELFAIDTQRKLVRLRHYPDGKHPHADAALLLLYGFHCSFDGDGRAVPVTRLRAALTASGHTDARVDRTLEPYRAAGLVKKRGQRKGSTYQLTPGGRQRAAALANALAQSLSGRGAPHLRP